MTNPSSKPKEECKIDVDIINSISNKEHLDTKDILLNGTEKSGDIIVNGNTIKELDCDIDNSVNTTVITNGVNMDSDSKSIQLDVSHESVVPVDSQKKTTNEKQNTEKKKEHKKNKSSDKQSSADKKKDCIKSKNSDSKIENEDTVLHTEVIDKLNGTDNKVVNGDGDRESSPGEDDDEKKRDAEVVFIQDMGFTVKIVSPGAEPLDIQVSSMELVQEIHQVLMDREDTCHRTCFSLQLDGVTLDNFAELKNIEGLKEGSVIKVNKIRLIVTNKHVKLV